MKVLIVDDEHLARERLKQLLAEIPGAEVVGEAARASDAIELAARLQPDVMLLDIRMPGLDGLGLARAAVDLPPIVFTTAHADHAVEAFEVHAVDYLLKPIKLERLRAALERVRAGRDASTLRAVEDVVRRLGEPPRLTARRGSSFEVFDAAAIARLTAADKYVAFVHDGREVLLEESLASLEQRLAAHGFLRVHRSELVNLRCIKRIELEARSCRLELTDGQVCRASRRIIPALKRRLGLD